MYNCMNRLLIALLSAFLVMQPIVGFAFDGIDGQVGKADLAKKARQMRAEQAKKYKGIIRQRAAAQSYVLNTDLLQKCSDGCCISYVISPDDFGVDRDTTYVITLPGKYMLQEDVAFSPVDEFTPAIVVLCDNVTLDLCGHTLSQGNTTANAYGVQIGEGYFYDDPDFVLKNIEVTNGNIINFTAIGVFCYNGSFDEPTAQVAFQDLRFLGLNILDCGSSPSYDFASGINLDSAANDLLSQDMSLPVAYKNVLIKGCTANRCLGNGAILAYTFDNLVISNVQANDLLNTDTVFGTFAYAFYGKNFEMNNCTGNGVRQVDSSTEQCGGLDCESSVNVYVRNCQFNEAFGEGSVIVNSNLSYDVNAVFEDCQFNNSRGGKTAGLVVGVHMSDGPFIPEAADGMKFINCQFNGASCDKENALTRLTGGVATITLSNIIFENCQACNIHDNSPKRPVYGFDVSTFPQDPAYPYANNHNITFSNCTASDLSGNALCVGIALPVQSNNRTSKQGIQTNIVIENCIAERIYSRYNTDKVAGIAEYLTVGGGNNTSYPIMKNLLIKGCRVSDVRSNQGGFPSALSAGILVESVQNPVILDNSITDCDRGILFTGTDDIIPNCFQLALTKEEALVFPAEAVDYQAPAASSSYQFSNLRTGNTVTVTSAGLDARHDFICPATGNLTALDWMPGDAIRYTVSSGSALIGLTPGQIYYAIVYSPGFTVRGLVQNNNVGNCSSSGYQDDRKPTMSAWINNMALLNGTEPTHDRNFAITWPNKHAQVDKGTLGKYPKCPNKNFNTSLIYAKEEHKKHHHSHHHSRG